MLYANLHSSVTLSQGKNLEPSLFSLIAAAPEQSYSQTNDLPSEQNPYVCLFTIRPLSCIRIAKHTYPQIMNDLDKIIMARRSVSSFDKQQPMSHFYLAAKEKGINGDLTLCKEAPAHDKWIPIVKFQTTK